MWNSVHSGLSTGGLILNSEGNRVILWGTGYDSCFSNAAVLVAIDTSGNLIIDTTYELTYCSDEGAIRFISEEEGLGYYLITQNDVLTPQDSSYVHYLNGNFGIQWTKYLSQNVRSEITKYAGKNYVSVDNAQTQQILRFYQSGIVDTLNQIQHPYFQVAPQRVFTSNGLVFEFGNQLNNDSAFVCLVYDTIGNAFTSFAFDANILENEVPWSISVHGNQIFHVSSGLALANTYPASCGVTGIVNWIDTIPHRMHLYDGACLDTINSVGYVFCDGSPNKILFSYDLMSGVRIDSLAIDSVDALFTGIKSGPSGGVFLFYNKQNTDTILLDQYDAHFNLIWRGYTVHPTCTSFCDPQDFIFDSLGYVYTLSVCPCSGPNILISKFGPSLVGLSEFVIGEQFQLSPNPATSTVSVSSVSPGSKILLFNFYGQLIYSDICRDSIYEINCNSLASGVYFVQIVTSSGLLSTQKLIINLQ